MRSSPGSYEKRWLSTATAIKRLSSHAVVLWVTTASSDTFAKSWRGITPLHSTAEDVRRLFPTCEEKETGCYIALGDQDVVIIYSGGVNIGPPECKDVPKGTVLAIVVRFRGFKKGRLQTQGRALYHI